MGLPKWCVAAIRGAWRKRRAGPNWQSVRLCVSKQGGRVGHLIRQRARRLLAQYWRENFEIARGGTDSALGPNMGANWRFGFTGTTYYFLNHLSTGAVLIEAEVLTPAKIAHESLVLHTSAQRNWPCLVERQIGALGPNIADATASFLGTNQGYFPSVFDQRLYVNAISSGVKINKAFGVFAMAGLSLNGENFSAILLLNASNQDKLFCDGFQ